MSIPPADKTVRLLHAVHQGDGDSLLPRDLASVRFLGYVQVIGDEYQLTLRGRCFLAEHTPAFEGATLPE